MTAAGTTVFSGLGASAADTFGATTSQVTSMPDKKNPHIVVVGAGAFGGWTALYLRRRGARVTLIDAWGPGNSRASSGGETRVIRGAYGPNQPYSRMSARALQLWSEHEERWKKPLLRRIGVLWMAEGDDSFERASLPPLKDAGIPYEEVPVTELEKRWPQINFENVKWGIYEPKCGFLWARNSCQTVLEGFLAEGGEFKIASADKLDIGRGELRGVTLADGSKLAADRYVFACGPWLGKIFPDVIGSRIRATRQEVFFFGVPGGDERYTDAKLPVWADHRDRFLYGIPGNQSRGFKIADDTRGPELDPTTVDRMITQERLQAARDYVSFRFPGLKGAPLVESRVCQYENTPDNNFIIDRHPQAANLWIVGGGSGHGFKHGPALGELVAGLVMEQKDAEAIFRLSRFG
jgi:glycine/D-amino acid oxidase-like deaminating enzyme